MQNKLYGIKQCDTVRKAKKWLSNHNVEFDFHDFRQDGIEASWLAQVEKEIGWETLLNKRGTTFRQLDSEDKSGLDKEKAITLMLEHPTLIKRPVLMSSGHYFCGFSDSNYAKIFS